MPYPIRPSASMIFLRALHRPPACGIIKRGTGEERLMETLLWLGVLIAAGIVVWLAAPHHAKLIADRDLPKTTEWWD